MFDLSMTLAWQRSQKAVREALEGDVCPGAALEVTGGTPSRARRDVGGGLRLKTWNLRKSRV
jgi:hypothetical protein